MRFVVDLIRHGLRWHLATETPQHVRNFVALQPIEPDRHRKPATEQVFQSPRQLARHIEFSVSIGYRHQQRHFRQPLGQVTKQRQGGIVGPVEIFEN